MNFGQAVLKELLKVTIIMCLYISFYIYDKPVTGINVVAGFCA